MITVGDFVETYFKLKQRGADYLLSKLSFDNNTRVKNTFDHLDIESSNYWIIPELKEYWNKIITGNPHEEYADYIVKKYFQDTYKLKLLSLGCGSGSHEIKFAKHSNFIEVKGLDLAPKLIEAANKNALQNNLSNLKYEVANVYDYPFEKNYFDIILFHSSLHHFKNIDELLGGIIKNALKKNGLLVIHEYVGPDRIQWTKEQLHEVRAILSTFPKKHKKRYRSSAIKKKAYRAGKLRMIISDPSEAVESSAILPSIHRHYSTAEEKPLGGNLLMPLFKDIAHHFTDGSAETQKLLEQVFQKETTFLKNNTSDFVFGVYRNT